MRDTPKRFTKLYNQARETTSRKAKIRFHCIECCGYDTKEVKLCTDKGCVFYKIRQTG